MTDNEIIKALENAKLVVDDGDAETLAFFDSLIDFINRQKAEIERLKCEMGKLLPKDCSYAMQMEVSNKLESQIKSEAIKEFAERLKGKCYEDFQETYEMLSPYVTDDDIDNLVKEMTEVNEK